MNRTQPSLSRSTIVSKFCRGSWEDRRLSTDEKWAKKGTGSSLSHESNLKAGISKALQQMKILVILLSQSWKRSAENEWVLQGIFQLCPSLISRGVRDIIDPIGNGVMCCHWKTLPLTKSYLGVRMKDPSGIIDRLGHPRTNPWRLTKSIVWYPFNVSSNTKCDGGQDSTKHSEPTQTILPLDIDQSLRNNIFFSLKDIGAVASGNNKSIEWIRNDMDDCEKGGLPLLDEESDDENAKDSGIDSSAVSSLTPGHSQRDLRAESNLHPLMHGHYKLAVICTLSKELMAVYGLFDDKHECLLQHEDDTTTNALGEDQTMMFVWFVGLEKWHSTYIEKKPAYDATTFCFSLSVQSKIDRNTYPPSVHLAIPIRWRRLTQRAYQLKAFSSSVDSTPLIVMEDNYPRCHSTITRQ